MSRDDEHTEGTEDIDYEWEREICENLRAWRAYRLDRTGYEESEDE